MSPKKSLEIHILGAAGEQHAALFLEKQGFTILARNYRTKLGEIDLIIKKNNMIAFVEVKTRTAQYFHSSYLITPSKQRKIARAAQQFISEHRLHGDLILRFDTVFVSVKENAVDFEYIQNAFCAPQQDYR